MRSTAARVLAGAAAVVAAVVLFVLLQGGSDDGATNGPGGGGAAVGVPSQQSEVGAVPTVVVRDGKPVGGVAELDFAAGERIRFKVESDVSDEIHVHGYEISSEVEAGKSVAFDFPATIEGVFEVELEQRGEQIAELRVSP